MICRVIILEESGIQDPVALAERGYTLADRLDDTCGIETEDSGVVLHKNPECLDLPFEGVDADGRVLNEDVAWTRLGDLAGPHSEIATLGLQEECLLLGRGGHGGVSERRRWKVELTMNHRMSTSYMFHLWGLQT